MRQKLIDIINSSGALSYGLPVILIFMVAMKQPATQHKPGNKTYTCLALGDSYTIGEQVEAKMNFPNQVVTMLQQKGYDFSSPDIIAKTGWTTDELEMAIKRADLHTGYDFVTLLIGVNNQYRGRTTEEYAPEFETLLKQAIQFTGNDTGHVIVLSIPDWGATPFAEGRDRQQIAKEIDEYNMTNEKIASRYHVHYLNITQSTRETAKDRSFIAPDGLHPSAKEYAKWAEMASALIVQLVKGK
jgi:lysophospholipase L1-like esterase